MTCKEQESRKKTSIWIFRDRFQASFICGNKSDINQICDCHVNSQIGLSEALCSVKIIQIINTATIWYFSKDGTCKYMNRKKIHGSKNRI